MRVTTTAPRVGTTPLSKVRLRDVPGVAWTLAVGFAPRARDGGRRARLLSAATWLYWCATVLVLPGMRHHDRLVVARVGRRSFGAQVAIAGRIVVAVVGLEVAVFAILLLPEVLVWWAPAMTWVVLGCLGAWLVTSLLTALALLTPTLARIWAVGAEARRRLGTEQTAADLATVRSTRWTVDSVTSRLPHGGLAVVAAHVRATVPLGETVVVQAASANHVRLYERYGLAPLAIAPWTLVGEHLSPGRGRRGHPRTAVPEDSPEVARCSP